MEKKEYTEQLMVNFGEDGKTLLPVVTQDCRTKEVLILSFINREAFEETLRSGYATYWSRSRNELWKKGLTSGDMLKVEEIRINCEQNSFLFLVTPMGKGAQSLLKPMSIESVMHPSISSSVISFSFCLQSFLALGSFPMSWLFESGGLGIEASASTSVFPVNSHG